MDQSVGNIKSCEFATEGLREDLENKGACEFSGGLTHMNDRQVRTKPLMRTKRVMAF